MVVILRGSQLSVMTDLFYGCKMTCRMPFVQEFLSKQSETFFRQPAIHIPSMLNYIQESLQWARIHVRWTLNDWTPVLFTDESRFRVDFTDR